MEVLPPSFQTLVASFGRNEGGNMESIVCQEVIILGKLLPLPAGCDCFLGQGENTKMVQLDILFMATVKMDIIPVGLKPCCGRCQVMRGKFLYNGTCTSVIMKMCTEWARNFVGGLRK
eukprot:15362147-Ditylum_brightwellii.AAC.1